LKSVNQAINEKLMAFWVSEGPAIPVFPAWKRWLRRRSFQTERVSQEGAGWSYERLAADGTKSV